jgi:hypothetical protein
MRAVWLATGIVGALVLLLFDEWFTLAFGVLSLVGWVAWGAWMIAAPGFIDEE